MSLDGIWTAAGRNLDREAEPLLGERRDGDGTEAKPLFGERRDGDWTEAELRVATETGRMMDGGGAPLRDGDRADSGLRLDGIGTEAKSSLGERPNGGWTAG